MPISTRFLKVVGSIVFFVLAIIETGKVSLARQISSEDEFRHSVLRILEKKHFLKNATCAQFSSLILTRNGLPAIGRMEPIKGSRGNMDRRFEGTEPPIFQDETTWSERPYYDIALSSERLRAPQPGWALKLVRVFDLPGSGAVGIKRTSLPTLRTSFLFALDSAANRSSCALQGIQVQAEWTMQGQPHSLRRTLNAGDCISLFDVTSAKEPEDPVSKQINRFIKDDCSVGLRYYKPEMGALPQGVTVNPGGFR